MSALAFVGSASGADEPPMLLPLVGYNEHRTNLPGGRHANVSTNRAMVVKADSTDRRSIGGELVNEAGTWTQFAGWSPDGETAVVLRGWESVENAQWEEEHKTFRFTPEGWLVDSYLVDVATGKVENVTGVERVSFYNSGLFFWPDDPTKLGFTALIGGNSKPFSMDRDGHNKTDLTKNSSGFAYGFSSSPDGSLDRLRFKARRRAESVCDAAVRSKRARHDRRPRWTGRYTRLLATRHGQEMSVNAQVMYYPTKIGTMRGTLSTAEERANWPASEKQRFENLKAFFDSGVDPYAVMLSEAKRRGREALLTFRMNDDHGNDFLRTQFQVDHPEWRLGTEEYRGKGALDFGREEVRDHMFRLIEEAVKRSDCDGIELDFNRFPTFFKDGTTTRLRCSRLGQERHPTHHYEKPGAFIVTLKVEGPAGKARRAKVWDVTLP